LDRAVNHSKPEQLRTLTAFFTWGLDLSGQDGNPSIGGLQGAGGIGGLLAVWDTNDPVIAMDEIEAIYFYDGNGNGNVGQLVNPNDGKILAAYEYDPCGNTVASAGSGSGDVRVRPRPLRGHAVAVAAPGAPMASLA